jgi:hypothetical protein
MSSGVMSSGAMSSGANMQHTLATITHIFSFTLLDALSFTCIISTIAMYLCGMYVCARENTHVLLQTHVHEDCGRRQRTRLLPGCAVSHGRRRVSAHTLHIRYMRSCLAWLYYGWMRADTTVTVVNGVGLLLEIAYMMFYWRYTKNKVCLCAHACCTHVWPERTEQIDVCVGCRLVARRHVHKHDGHE